MKNQYLTRGAFCASLAVLFALVNPVNGHTDETEADKTSAATSSALDKIVTSAHPAPHRRFELLQSSSVLQGDDLALRLEGTIGETLSSLPGITSSFFGNGASRPIIRGLDGDRIRVLINGVGSIDASTTSADHAVAGEPLTARSLEVLRGPANLMYGSNAVGGVVNILDGRIPDSLPENGFSGQATVLYGTAAEERAAGANVDAALGNMVLHLSGFFRETDNYKIPGYAILEDHDEDHGDEHDDDHGHEDDDDHEEDESTLGFVGNSDLKTKGGTAGLSWVWDNGHIGFAYSRFDSNYGIPPGAHEHEEEHDEEHDEEHGDEHDDEHGHDDEGEEEEEIVRIDLVQDRFDVAGEVRGNMGLFEAARFRFGYADYEHVELEGDEIGTVFANKGWETRLELIQKPVSNINLEGAWGIQLRERDFSAIGDEAFVPPSDLFSWGIFTFQEVSFDQLTFELGARFERQETKSSGIKRSFNAFSISGGAAWSPDEDWLLGVTLGRSERPPTPEELFANGPHLAIGAFEIGDLDLINEKAVNLEAFIRKREGPVTGSLTGYVTWYDDFISQVFTGGEEDGLPILIREQTDARFIGLEAELAWEAVRTSGFDLTFDAVADYVRATDTANSNPLPRIPPFRFLLGAEAEMDWLTGRIEIQRITKQSRVALDEDPTEGYTLLNASLTVRPFRERPDLTILIRGKNLTNEEARVHTSFLKNFAPLPGRDVRVSLRMTF